MIDTRMNTNVKRMNTNMRMGKWISIRLFAYIRLYSLPFACLSFIFACLLALTISLSSFFCSCTYAAMNSTDYKIQMPNLNFSSGNVSSTDYKLGFTGGETGVGLYSSTGYKVRAGFWYIKSIIPFGFSISPTSVDLGTLIAGTPRTQAITLTVSAGGAGGYQVTTQENKPLTSGAGNTIPDTTCDAGGCTESTATTWSLDTTYGFGYTMHKDDVPTPFPTGTLAGNQYKQFANQSLNEIAEPVMLSSAVGKNRSATMTMKVNIAGTQAAGSYQNIITFIATPGY